MASIAQRNGFRGMPESICGWPPSRRVPRMYSSSNSTPAGLDDYNAGEAVASVALRLNRHFARPTIQPVPTLDRDRLRSAAECARAGDALYGTHGVSQPVGYRRDRRDWTGRRASSATPSRTERPAASSAGLAQRARSAVCAGRAFLRLPAFEFHVYANRRSCCRALFRHQQLSVI
jgi:hypothetical protein